MHCYLCGRRLARAAATLEWDGNTGHAGPTCARRAGLLPPRVQRARVFTVRRAARRAEGQGVLELAEVRT